MVLKNLFDNVCNISIYNSGCTRPIDLGLEHFHYYFSHVFFLIYRKPFILFFAFSCSCCDATTHGILQSIESIDLLMQQVHSSHRIFSFFDLCIVEMLLFIILVVVIFIVIIIAIVIISFKTTLRTTHPPPVTTIVYVRV